MAQQEPGQWRDLAQLREEIDQLDQQLQTLLNQRAQCAQQVAQVKTATEGEDTQFYRPEREAQVLRRIMERNTGPLSNEEMARLFREVMSACLALERPIKVAYLGPEGTFTQQAALKHFGHSAICLPMAAIDEVFREVEAGSVDYGVVPIENSTEGVISHTLDSFMDSGLQISGEVVLRIHQHLLLGENTRPDKISTIYSHASSLAQCRKWIDAHYPGVERVPMPSNAEAARKVCGEWHSAAIAGDMAAQLYGLKKHAENIEDTPDNATRFLIIGRHTTPASGEDKTSLMLSMRNQPGALYQLLEVFNRHQVDMTRIESRPSRSGAWNYVFFIDCTGHQQEPRIQTMLAELGERAAEMKVLGSYPKGVL